MQSFETLYLQYITEKNFNPCVQQQDIVKKFDIFAKTLSYQTPFSVKQSFLKRFISPKNTAHYTDKIGFYLYGDVGRGKSMLMDLFFQYVPIKNKYRVHFHAFMQDVHKNLQFYRTENTPNPIINVAQDIAKKYQLICFDELQILDITDAMVIGRLFDALLKLNVRFVVTSNRPPQDLYKNGLNRGLFEPFIDMIQQYFMVENLNHHTDYRKIKLQNTDIYISPLNQNTTDKMNHIWNILTDNAISTPLYIDHQQRKITIKHHHKTTARMDFNDICDAALGAGDYLEIMTYFDVILLENIPQMTADMRNQATRFRNFIDAAYESKVKIYFSSAVSADNLYIKGDFSFEFERTLSRISEMTSKSYCYD